MSHPRAGGHHLDGASTIVVVSVVGIEVVVFVIVVIVVAVEVLVEVFVVLVEVIEFAVVIFVVVFFFFVFEVLGFVVRDDSVVVVADAALAHHIHLEKSVPARWPGLHHTITTSPASMPALSSSCGISPKKQGQYTDGPLGVKWEKGTLARR